MLARPEVGTRGHILLWLASKNPKEYYAWYSCEDCAVAQYVKEAMHRAPYPLWSRIGIDKKLEPLEELNEFAYEVADGAGDATFGDLYLAACLAWYPAAKKIKEQVRRDKQRAVITGLQVHPRVVQDDGIDAVLRRPASRTSAERRSTGGRDLLQRGRKELENVC
jgi:hypothetical protein